jgi:antagonist of KipI
MDANFLKLDSPGLCTLVVDQGRPRSRSLGVPVGGAADRWSLAVGNALVGNPPDAAALEVTLAGPIVQASCPIAGVVFGAPFELTSARQAPVAGKTFTLQPGEELRIGSARRGARAYLCLRGGLQVPQVLASRASLAPLPAGAELPCVAGVIGPHFLAVLEEPDDAVVELHVLAGSQEEWFAATDFYEQEFQISADSNRMGLRLHGQPLTVPDRELLSEPVCPGTVQVTRDGQCIILGVDAQTIGGYPRLAQVISADLDRLGQLRPGQVVRFLRVDLALAEQLYRERQAELARLLRRLRAACA